MAPKLIQTPEWIKDYLKGKGVALTRFEGKRLFFLCVACKKETSISAFSHIRTYERMVGDYHFQCVSCFKKVAMAKKKAATKVAINLRNKKKECEFKELFLREGSEMLSSFTGVNESVTLKCKKCGVVDTFTSLQRVLSLPNRFLCRGCQITQRSVDSGIKQRKYTREFVSVELEARGLQLLNYSESDYSFSTICQNCGRNEILVKNLKRFFNQGKIQAICSQCRGDQVRQRQSIPLKEAEKHFLSRGSVLYEYKGNLKRVYFRCTQCKGVGTYHSFIALRLHNPDCLCGDCSFKNRCGEGAYNYNPSLTEEDRKLRRFFNPNYSCWRGAVKKNYRSRCAITKKFISNGHCHHLYSYLNHPQYRYEAWNGVYLSPKEHYLFHSRYGRRGATCEDFQNFYRERTGVPFFNLFQKRLG